MATQPSPEAVEIDVVEAAVAKGNIKRGKALRDWLGDWKERNDEDRPEKRFLFGKKKAQRGERPSTPPEVNDPPEAIQWEVDTRQNFQARLNAAASPPPSSAFDTKRLWLTHVHHYTSTFDGLEPGDRDFNRLTAILGPRKPASVFEENGPCGAITLNAFSLKGVPRGILGGVRPYLLLHMACSGGRRRRAGRTARLMRYKKSLEGYLCNEAFVLHVYHPVTVLRIRVMLRRSALNMLGEDEVLGEVLLPIRKAVPGHTVQGWFHLEPSEAYDGLYCGRIKLSIRVDYLSKIDQICANFATPPEKLRHLPKYNPANVYTSAMRIKELLWDKGLRDAFFDFKKVGRWDPTCLRVSVVPMLLWLALCRWLPGDRWFGMVTLLLVAILTKSYYRTKARGRLGCLAGNRGGGQAEAAAMVQALSETLPTIVAEKKKKIRTSRRVIDDLYEQPGFTKPAGLKEKKRQKNILKQNRKHRNLATGAVHGFTKAGGKITSGVVGVFASPVRGLQQDGAKGLIKGTALGITGLVRGTVGGVAGAVAAVGAGAVNTGIALGRGTANVVGLGDQCEDWSATESEDSTDDEVEDVDDNADPLPEFQGSKGLGFLFFCSKFAPKNTQEGVRFLQRKMSKWIRITTEYTRIVQWESDYSETLKLMSILVVLTIVGLLYPQAFGHLWYVFTLALQWVVRPVIGLVGIELLSNGTRLPRTVNRVVNGILGASQCFGACGLEKMKCFTAEDVKPEHIWQFDPHNNPDAFLEALKWRSRKAKAQEDTF